MDAGTWARGRAWALWKALNTLTKSEAEAERRRVRFGWRIVPAMSSRRSSRIPAAFDGGPVGAKFSACQGGLGHRARK
jgi:hypothetical protein